MRLKVDKINDLDQMSYGSNEMECDLISIVVDIVKSFVKYTK